MTSQPHRLSDAEIQNFIDTKTKPLGALGRMETLAAQIARFRNNLTPRIETCELVIFAGDHGIAKEGVSAFPQAVTRQMVQNFLAGGAAANVFAASLDVPVHVVDSGVAGAALEATNLLSHSVGPGTQSSLHGPAMTGSELAQALQSGADVTVQTQAQALAFGEMGIGNTASASLLAHKVTGLPLDSLIGRGTGIDTSGLARKRAVLDEAAARTGATLDTDTALAEYAGFEMAMMVGSMQAAAEDGRIVLVDGFIATASAAAALIRAPHIRPAMVFCHRSQEAGHRVLLDWLSADPLLDMDMRLGEGTGALLAWPLVKAASAMLCDMASFDSAGVSQG